MTLASVVIPLRLPSLANMRGHWSKKARIVKAQRDAVTLALKDRRMAAVNVMRAWLHGEFLDGQHDVLVTTITRCAPRQLDPHDNLPMSCKPTIDAVAAYLGLDDRDARLRFVCRQEKAKWPSIRIDFDVKQLAAELKTLEGA